MRKIFGLSVFSVTIFQIEAAHAHVGHLGEMAGHAHWVGLGAVIVAGAIAVVAGKLSGKAENVEDGEEEATEEAVQS